ncbi:MAG: HAD-IIIA family hydrolase, partial [Thermoplasmata archaeon]|nr:HAD-IIIA family hydrolase [Thermoplasmata archaeon]
WQFLGVEKNLDSLATRITRNYPKPDGVEWRVYDDVPGALEELEGLGYVLGVISNFSPVLKEIFGRLGLEHHFKTIISSADVKVLKPDPEIFRIALDRTRVKPQESIYVGNAYDPDVVGCRSAGMTPVLIDRGDERQETDCPKISQLGELVGLLR